MSQRQAAAFFKIPRSTLKNKLKSKSLNKLDHTFIASEEDTFAAHTILLFGFGFAVGELDFRFAIRAKENDSHFS